MHNESSLPEQEILSLVRALKDDPVGALSALTAYSKKQAAREWIDRLLSDRSPIYAIFKSPEPKARKNAARLLGALGNAGDTEALVLALKEETTRFVVPSLLLALGAVGSAGAKAAIEAYSVPAAADESEIKHVGEISEAKKKALATFDRELPLPEQKKLDAPANILAVSPAGFAPILQKELSALGLPGEVIKDGVLVSTADLARLYRARCLQEAIIPIAEGLPIDPSAIAAAAEQSLKRPYRIELHGYAGDRAAFIRTLSRALGGGDNPSHYLDELRIVCSARNLCSVWVKPCNVPDHRFDYRKQAISASIAPSTAACLVRYALPFVSADGSRIRAFDPFCGSGTLLLELEKAVPGSALLGADISENALSAARINAQAARSGARFIKKDILRFEPKEAFDLVITNMPFGNRVGSHETNDPLYHGFIHLLPKLLSPGGAALLYTMEHRLLADCLKKEPALKIASELTTEAGGLNPRVTLVKRK